jgi:hypothetical protein
MQAHDPRVEIPEDGTAVRAIMVALLNLNWKTDAILEILRRNFGEEETDPDA